MPIDFKKLTEGRSADLELDPRKIFAALPSKPYAYLRDVQATVLLEWFQRRSDPDLVVKMNTGGGKTLVGLLALKSGMNEGIGPALYVAADSYLADQVRVEASNLGLQTTDDPRSPDYIAGRAIAVVNVWKVLNGRSVFGVGEQKIEIGSVVVDDAHACLGTAEQQFKLRISRGNPAYQRLLDLLIDAIRDQSQSAALELLEGSPGGIAPIPFWVWSDRASQIVEILHAVRDSDDIKWSWPLMRDHLLQSTCIITTDEVEIRPPCLPIDVIPSFGFAARRLFLTATLSDTSVLVADFGADPEPLAHPIQPTSATDLGDRMILVPQEVNPEISEDQAREWIAGLAGQVNVVVIVPSNRRAELWKSHAVMVLHAEDLHAGVDSLKSGHVGLVVMVNKYDGVDLPDDACRVLVIDGLPEVYSPAERHEAAALSESDALLVRQIHRIEQGMGRAVRSTDDYCAVILLGARLTERIHNPRGRAKFSMATRAQLDLSAQLAEQMVGATIEGISEVIQKCLGRDSDWLTASRNALVRLPDVEETHDTRVAAARRRAFEASLIGQHTEAHDEMQKAVEAANDPRDQGWLLQETARYVHFQNPAKAQEILLAAIKRNGRVTRPLTGVSYGRLEISHEDQAERAASFLADSYASGTDMIVAVNALTDSLRMPMDANRFEDALDRLASHLGFASQRPDRDTGTGPDVLWALGELRFLVIECKSAASSPQISKSYADQVSGHMHWFESKYDATCSATPIVVHPVLLLVPGASPHPDLRVMGPPQLKGLVDSVRSFVGMLSTGTWADPAAVKVALHEHRLDPASFLGRYSKAPIQA
ncbi:MAG: helicase C-terminal domain-containing protein [Acidimicrobiia bacterium]